MNKKFSEEGSASEELGREALRQWALEAAIAGVDLEGFDPEASHDDLMSWALSKGLDIACMYARFSTQMQQSTGDQIRECVIWAARNKTFVPPYFISIDEGEKGRKARRAGLNRTRQILKSLLAKTFLVYKASRLFRQAGKGFAFIQDECVDAGIRAVSVSQGIDTNDKKSWKLQLQIHGLMDDLLLDTIADHVRSGQIGHFMQGHTTGALGVGYRRKEVPGGRPTNRGLPRTEPEVDPEAAELIRKHAALHLEGMSIREGVRRWNAASGPCDPRSTTGKMTATAYRRLFGNERLTGRWEFGRKRNQFSTRRDYVTQIEQPDEEVVTRQVEDLRILDDATFYALKQKFDDRKNGPREPRDAKLAKLWDLTTSMFYCSHCSTPEKPIRFYMAGANGVGMRCCNGDQCPHPSCVRRDEAVQAVCKSLAELIARDTDLVSDVVSRSREIDATADDDVKADIDVAQKKLRVLTNRVQALFELYEDSTNDDRREAKSRLRSAQSERGAAQADLNRLQKSLEHSTATLSAEDARKTLAEMSMLLSDASAGRLGGDAVYKALNVFTLLTGGRIWVNVQPRPGRKQTVVRGEFRPCLVRATTEFTGAVARDDHPGEKVSIWLRQPPRIELIADRVHELIDKEGLSHRDTAKQLQREGHNVNSGNVWYSYRRWYEMQGLPLPKQPYNNGNKRDSA